MDTMEEQASPDADHVAALHAIREAFATLLANEDVDILPNEGDGGDDIALAGERWTLYLEGWPGPKVAFIAIDDEPEDDASAADVEAAWRDAIPADAIPALTAADSTLDGILSFRLTATDDPVSMAVAAAMRNA